MSPDAGSVRSTPMDAETILILDFGSQYAQLIARRVREAGAFSLLMAPDASFEELAALKPKGIILSGGPSSIHEEGSPRCDPRLFELGVPILGICYGMQLGCHLLGCPVDAAESREYGRSRITMSATTATCWPAFPSTTTVWMSHGDQVSDLAEMTSTASPRPTPVPTPQSDIEPCLSTGFSSTPR